MTIIKHVALRSSIPHTHNHHHPSTTQTCTHSMRLLLPTAGVSAHLVSRISRIYLSTRYSVRATVSFTYAHPAYIYSYVRVHDCFGAGFHIHLTILLIYFRRRCSPANCACTFFFWLTYIYRFTVKNCFVFMLG